MSPSVRTLALVLGDQLDAGSPALRGLDPARDRVLMAEVPVESTQVWSSKPRTALFLAAMRHFAEELRGQGLTVDYLSLGTHPHPTLGEALAAQLSRLRPEAVQLVEPGEARVEEELQRAAASAGRQLLLLEDPHFLVSRRGFATWAGRYRQLRMETFYRAMRKRHGVLMDGDQPVGGAWNFDQQNRERFAKSGPGPLPAPPRFPPDALTRATLDDVQRHFPEHPGSLDRFAQGLPFAVTRAQALQQLDDFITHRLPRFGRHQDAMWGSEPFLFHSLLSPALNLKLLSPLEVITAAEREYRAGRAPLESVEGFVRQILGWREYIRGVYWWKMPGLRSANQLQAHRPLPRFFWTAQTQMNCLREVLSHTLEWGYAHHIERLMVLGLFGLLAEVEPRQVQDWFLAVYCDAVEWAELPNVAGMALFADGGGFTSKPYAASGQYIARMSNHCRGCRFRPEQAAGDDACPFTTLYWNFLDRHQALLRKNPRTALMAKSAARKSEGEREAIRQRALQVLNDLADS